MNPINQPRNRAPKKNMENGKRYSLTLHNRIDQISQLAEFTERLAEDNNIDCAMAMSLNLALEEAVTNVVLYAYPEEFDGTIEIFAQVSDGKLTFVISDSGKPFDPTKVPDADTSVSVEDRPIGGLGIFLVRNIMNEVHYEFKDNKNILTMIKNI